MPTTHSMPPTRKRSGQPRSTEFEDLLAFKNLLNLTCAHANAHQ
jgi:hypothetical protein